MNDSVAAQIRVAVFALSHAKVESEGETKACLTTAIAACGDALDAHLQITRTRQNLEVLADTLAAPGGEAA